MSQNFNEANGGLELLRVFEIGNNGNGIATNNGHALSANGKAKPGRWLPHQLRDTFRTDDPFPLGLEPVINESRNGSAPEPNSAAGIASKDFLIPHRLFGGSLFTAQDKPPFEALEQVQSPDPESKNSCAECEAAIHPAPALAEDTLKTEETSTTAVEAADFSGPMQPQVETPTEWSHPTQINEPVDSSPYRTVRLTIPKDGPFFPFDGVDPRVAEQYRILRTAILLHPGKPKVIAISSGSSGDGKTLTSINFAGILAMKDDVKVLIVEADLRKCSLGATLGIDSAPGLAEVLDGQVSIEQAIVRAEQLPNFYILTCGDVKLNPAELLDSPQFRQFVEDARQQFSYIVFDTTPAAAVADFKLVMQACDGVLMVVRPEHTEREAFQRAFELIPEKKWLGAVINAFDDWFLWNKMDRNYYYSGAPRAAKQPQPLFRWRRRAPQSPKAGKEGQLNGKYIPG